MNTIHTFVISASLVFGALSAPAQSNFQNLNFEWADLSNPSGPYNEVPISDALPGWNGSIGGVPVTEVWADGDSAGEAAICVEGPGTNRGGIGPLDGYYSVYLFSGGNPLGGSVGVNASITQAGTIPANANSLEFDAAVDQASATFSVSFDGNSISPVALYSGIGEFGQDYEVYGVNIATYAGQTGSLEFTAVFNDLGQSATEFDDITFSTTTVAPEPNTLALAVMGGLALAARCWPKKGP
jgi:hypothetical protein